MASRMGLLITAAMAVVVVGALSPAPATNEVSWYLVGGSGGWNVGVDYEAWARDITFRFGDTIAFTYSKVNDSVVILDDVASYNTCTVPFNAPKRTSDKEVTLDHPGRWFFISGVKDHCESGMKLSIEVAN